MGEIVIMMEEVVEMMILWFVF